MKRLWPLLALLLVAAISADENRQFRVGQSAFENQLYDVAERQLLDFLQKFPQSERAEPATYLLGQAQLNLGKTEEAVKTFQDELAKWPDKHPDGVQFWMAEAFSRGRKYAEAEPHYNAMIEQFPRSKFVPQALYGLAFAQFKQAHLHAASQTLDNLAKAEPKGGLVLEADLLRGQLALALEDFTKAEAILDGVIQKAGAGNRIYYQAHYWQGQSLMRRNQFPESVAKYAVITDSYKANPNKPVDAQLAAEAWFGAGWAQWKMEKFGDAAESYSAALAIAPADPLKRDALLKLAEASVRSGKITEGVARLKEFLVAHPADPLADQVQLAIADLLFGKGENAAALAEYIQLINTYPKSPLLAKAYAQAGWCSWQLKVFPDALGYFEKALPLLTDQTQAANIQFKIADVHFALGQLNEAVASYQQLISAYPNTPALDRALFQLGEAYRQLRNPEGASAAFDSLVKQYPHSEFAPQAQYTLGQLLSGQNDETAARTAYALVVSNFPSSVWASNASLAVGESYSREAKYDQAIAEFDKLTANGFETDLSQQAFYSRGWCYAMLGKREKTLADFLEFLKAHPQAKLAPEIQYWVADEYLRQRDYVKAQAQFQLLAETYPASKVADVALYFAGRAAYARQDYKTAIEKYESLVKQYPQSAWRCEARFGQGDALSELGQFDDALLVFDALIKEFPDCSLVGEANGRKGDMQSSLGRYDAALISYQKALDAAKDANSRNQALYKLGKTYESQKKPEEALLQYAKAYLDAKAVPDQNAPPEQLWSCRAAKDAASLYEQSNQWLEAIRLYGILGDHCPDLKPMADDRIRKLRVMHPETMLSH